MLNPPRPGWVNSLLTNDGASLEQLEQITMDAPLSPHETKRLLARTAIIQSACELDLLVFLYRHPRILLTSEQLAGFAGYPLRDIAQALETMIDAGLLGRTAQQSGHAARLYLLLLEGPLGGGVRALLEMASTCEGRRRILEMLNEPRTRSEPLATTPALTLVSRG